MLRNFLKNRKAQNTAEYALLIALVVAGIIAMQTYAQRALQARIHDVSNYMATATGNNTLGIGSNEQYEPYYLNSQYTTNTDSSNIKAFGQNLVAASSNEERQRTGGQTTSYNGTQASF